jgi:hypothetical protein
MGRGGGMQGRKTCKGEWEGGGGRLNWATAIRKGMSITLKEEYVNKTLPLMSKTIQRLI